MAAVFAISTKFGMVTQFDPSCSVQPVTNLKFKKSKMAEAAILRNPKSRYLGNGFTDRHKIWHGYAYWPSEQARHLKFLISTNQRWRTATILTIQNSHISVTNNLNLLFVYYNCSQTTQSYSTNIRHAGRETTAATQGSTIYRRVKLAKLLPHTAHSD